MDINYFSPFLGIKYLYLGLISFQYVEDRLVTQFLKHLNVENDTDGVSEYLTHPAEP